MPVLNFTQDGKVVIPLPVPIENGGTGAEDLATARTNLGLGTAALLSSSSIVDVESNQSISGKKSFTNPATKFGVGSEILSTVASQTGFYSGYVWNNSNLIASATSGGFVGINFYQAGIAFCYESSLSVGLSSASSATTKLLIGSSNASFPVRPSTPGGGTFSDSSDICLKKNIKPIIGALEKICLLSGCEFDWKFDEDDIEVKPRAVGFIAQSVEQHFPHWVQEDINGIKSVSLPFEFFALLVEAIKELTDRITTTTN